MRAGDLAELVALWRRSREDGQPWLEERMARSPADDLSRFRDVVSQQYAVWVACEGGRLVGLLACRPGEVDQLFVDPPDHGRGVGTALLEWAMRESPAGFILYTAQRNQRARDFYERRGLQVVAFGTSGPPELEPDVKYAWNPPETRGNQP
jgi:GNAT superfamily N-acetyltransferase